MDALTLYLRAASQRPFSWGYYDCLLWLADWIAVRHGIDPAAEWRGRYRSALGAARILKQRGGMESHINACLAPFGFCRAGSPVRGDIALVAAPEGEEGAILLDAPQQGKVVVACFGDRGIVYRRLPVLAAWRV